MTTATFILTRTIILNGATLEADRFFGYFPSEEKANARAEELDSLVYKNPAVKGMHFIFTVRKLMTDSTGE